MDSSNEATGTEIIEEQETAPKKKGRRSGLLIGMGVALLIIVAGAMIFAFRKSPQSVYKPTA